MKRVLTYGTYDLLHIGHINLLRRAKELGDYLIVGLSTDNFNKLKGKEAIHSYEERRMMLESIKFVDQIIPEENWQQKINDIKTHDVDIFVMGSDWTDKFDALKEHCRVVYLTRTEGISTTLLKERIAGP